MTNKLSTDVTYGRKENNAVDTYKAIEFIKRTLEKKGYNVPEEIFEDMYENGVVGDLFSTEDLSYPQMGYYETFDEEKAIEIIADYILSMIKYNNGGLLVLDNDYVLPNNINNIEDFK